MEPSIVETVEAGLAKVDAEMNGALDPWMNCRMGVAGAPVTLTTLG